MEKDIRLRHVRTVKDFMEFGDPDVIILPGSKNVITDLDHLKETGLAEKILQAAKGGKVEIVGLCGGYQMLGKIIKDPHHVETKRGSEEGLGLLPLETVLEKEKILGQVSGIHLPSGKKVQGYEIHHGVTQILPSPFPSPSGKTSSAPVFERMDGTILGHGNERGNIWGTYLHGVFDDDEFRRCFIDKIRLRKGLIPLLQVQSHYDMEKLLDALALQVREALGSDLNRIYQLIGLR